MFVDLGPGGAQDFRVTGGTQGISAAMARQLGKRVLLGHPVRRITQNGRGAVVYGALMTLNMAWPRASVYDPAGNGWYLRWFSVLLLVGAALTGGLTYAYLRRANRIAPLTRELATATAQP